MTLWYWWKDTQIDQENGKKYPKHKRTRLISVKVIEQLKGDRIAFSTNGTVICHFWAKSEKNSYLSFKTYTQFNSK